MDKKLIIDKIKLNKRYIGNEDLLDLFVECSLNKVDGLIDSINDVETYEIYIDKIISKSIIEVLKKENRYNLKKIEHNKINYKKFSNKFTNIHNETYPIYKLKDLYVNIEKISNKDFFDVIMLKYKEQLSIKEIQEKLDISEDNIVNILFDMSDYANKAIEL